MKTAYGRRQEKHQCYAVAHSGKMYPTNYVLVRQALNPNPSDP